MGRAAEKDAMQAFLDAHPPHCEVRDDWPLDPVVPLLARLCLASALPPTSGRSSILGIVTRGSRAVLFIDPPNPQAPSHMFSSVVGQSHARHRPRHFSGK